MRLSQPAGGQLVDSNDAKARVFCGKLLQNSCRGICGAVVRSNDFEIWIVEFEKCMECFREFFFLVARGKKHGKGGTLRISGRSALPQSRQLYRAPHHAQPV